MEIAPTTSAHDAECRVVPDDPPVSNCCRLPKVPSRRWSPPFACFLLVSSMHTAFESEGFEVALAARIDLGGDGSVSNAPVRPEGVSPPVAVPT
jgi:hypothetical protein